MTTASHRLSELALLLRDVTRAITDPATTDEDREALRARVETALYEGGADASPAVDTETGERRTIARPAWAGTRKYDVDGVRYSEEWVLTGGEIDGGNYDLVIEASVNDYVDADERGTFLARGPIEISVGRRIPENASENIKAWAGCPMRLTPSLAKEMATALALASVAVEEDRVDDGGIEEDNEAL